MTIHPLADVQANEIGDGTTIWQFVVVLAGARIGRHCNINAHCLIENDVVIGDRVTLKCGVYLWSGCRIEDDVFIGPNVTFTNDARPRSKQSPAVFQSVRVRRGASLGANATILGGVTIGEYALVGAGSVVTHDIPAFTLCYGVPATVRGYVCQCGESLPDTLSCVHCNRRYEMSHGQLRVQP